MSLGIGLDKNRLSGIICAAATVLLGWMVLGPFRKLGFLGEYSILLGKNPMIHVLIIVAIFLYLHLYITKPDVAKKSALNSISTVKDLVIYVIAALFIAGAAVNLYPADTLASLLGEQAGIVAVLVGVAIGSFLPACPFISYPIIGGLYAAGAGFPGVMGMLFGSGLGFACVIAADLSFFDSKIMGLRMSLTFISALIAGVLVYVSGITV